MPVSSLFQQQPFEEVFKEPKAYKANAVGAMMSPVNSKLLGPIFDYTQVNAFYYYNNIAVCMQIYARTRTLLAVYGNVGPYVFGRSKMERDVEIKSILCLLNIQGDTQYLH